MLSFQRKYFDIQEYNEDMKKYEDARFGNFDGEFLEPVSPVFTVSNKYYFPDDIRKELLG